MACVQVVWEQFERMIHLRTTRGRGGCAQVTSLRSLHVTCCRQINPLPFNPLHRRSLSCLFLPPTPVPLSYSGLRSSYDYELIQPHTSSNSVGNYGRARAQPQAYFSSVNRRSSCLLRYAETVCGLFRGSGGCGVGVCNDSDSDDPADDLLVSVDSLTGRVEADAVPSEVLELTTLDKFFVDKLMKVCNALQILHI